MAQALSESGAEKDDETLEDVFIRLVGRSIEDVERLSDEGVKEEDAEEE